MWYWAVIRKIKTKNKRVKNIRHTWNCCCEIYKLCLIWWFGSHTVEHCIPQENIPIYTHTNTIKQLSFISSIFLCLQILMTIRILCRTFRYVNVCPRSATTILVRVLLWRHNAEWEGVSTCISLFKIHAQQQQQREDGRLFSASTHQTPVT